MRFRASCPGTCGELFQGLCDGKKSLISCPVSLYTVLDVSICPGDGKVTRDSNMGKIGSLLIELGKIWSLAGVDIKVERIKSLPMSRGYASSTSELLCVLYSVAEFLGKPISPLEATEILISIEPSDGLAWRNLTFLDHIHGDLYRDLGPVPDCDILLLDPGGSVDTVSFNREGRAGEDCSWLFDRLLRSLRDKNIEHIASCATESSLLNQKLLHKEYLEPLVEKLPDIGGLGIVSAHSGTICGVIFHPKSLNRCSQIVKEINWNGDWMAVKTVPSGVYIHRGIYDE